MDEVCGYDAAFVELVPEDLKCVICHMVLKQAMQLAECGHRYCKGCFNAMKNFSHVRDDVLLCPIDRKNIDILKVFEDKAIQRIILDLKVICDHRNNGCHWSGELRALEGHLERCKGAKDKIQQKDVIDAMKLEIQGLKSRLSTLERAQREEGAGRNKLMKVFNGLYLLIFICLILYILFPDVKENIIVFTVTIGVSLSGYIFYAKRSR